MRKKPPRLGVVIPVYNESGNVKPLTDEIAAAMKSKLAFEIVFVDDGSTDSTLAELQELAHSRPYVVVRTHDGNHGQSAAIRTGVEASGAPVIAILDGDGQNDPKDIPRLYELLVEDPRISMVVGERRKRKDSFLKLVSSRIANKVRSGVLGDGVPDTGCGLKVFYRQGFLDLPAFDHMHRFLPALMQRNGGRVCSVPVNHRPRVRGTSKYGVRNRLWVGITDLIGVIWLQRRHL